MLKLTLAQLMEAYDCAFRIDRLEMAKKKDVLSSKTMKLPLIAAGVEISTQVVLEDIDLKIEQQRQTLLAFGIEYISKE